jgi:hypothetical protein
MSKQLTDDEIQEAAQKLTRKEYSVFVRFIESAEQPLLPEAQVVLFARYLAGVTTFQMANEPGQEASWGQICHAKVIGDWDGKLREHTEALIAAAAAKVQRVTIDSVDVVSTWLDAANGVYKAMLQKFVETGDPTVLGINGLKDYAKLLETLKTLTGTADKVVKASPAPQPLIESPNKKKKPALLEKKGTADSDEAAEIMKELLGK